ncbi:MAG: hypothetical protein J3K34DRAFT_169841 [Monoraphidium minutum]|nr:MAG: hypothetical protein J3K34DRAFT_169841 [Monoraphidium minutum]
MQQKAPPAHVPLRRHSFTAQMAVDYKHRTRFGATARSRLLKARVQRNRAGSGATNQGQDGAKKPTRLPHARAAHARRFNTTPPLAGGPGAAAGGRGLCGCAALARPCAGAEYTNPLKTNGCEEKQGIEGSCRNPAEGAGRQAGRQGRPQPGMQVARLADGGERP